MKVFSVKVRTLEEEFNDDGIIDIAKDVVSVALKNNGTLNATLFNKFPLNPTDGMITFAGNVSGGGDFIVITRNFDSIRVRFAAGAGTKRISILKSVAVGVEECNL
jgi:hypothetical protein